MHELLGRHIVYSRLCIWGTYASQGQTALQSVKDSYIICFQLCLYDTKTNSMSDNNSVNIFSLENSIDISDVIHQLNTIA